MRVIGCIGIEVIEEHLRDQHSGVSLPCRTGECLGFKVQLDDDDVQKLVLWWEFQEETQNENCRVTSLFDSATAKERVMDFIEGVPGKGLGPADLRVTPNREPTIITDAIESNFLYLIDGNHRTCAQYLSRKSFQDVSAFLCVYPALMKWAYVPKFYKG
jgi:hypothetical protein